MHYVQIYCVFFLLRPEEFAHKIALWWKYIISILAIACGWHSSNCMPWIEWFYRYLYFCLSTSYMAYIRYWLFTLCLHSILTFQIPPPLNSHFSSTVFPLSLCSYQQVSAFFLQIFYSHPITCYEKFRFGFFAQCSSTHTRVDTL